MICLACGAQNFAQAAFCTTCGARPGTASLSQPARAAATVMPPLAEAYPTVDYPVESYQPGRQLRESTQLTPSYSGVPVVAAPAAALQYTQPAGQPYVIAGKFERWLAFVIDCLLCVPIILFVLIPILGAIIVGLGMPAYWLLRDIRGASLGKLMLGLRVVQLDGQPATTGALMFRNLIYAAPHLLHFIPYLGTFLIIFLITPLKSLEALLVLATNRRLGDRMAGTIVIKAR
jgi:uncharacterized RDD family membrane protein YckC